jgi:hypothetical protein
MICNFCRRCRCRTPRRNRIGSALFYTYICIDKDLLVKNLNGNEELVNKTRVHLPKRR